MIAIRGQDHEPRAWAKGDACLHKILVEIRSAFIETLVEFDLERLVGPKAGGESLIQPESDLLVVFGVFRWLRLLRARGKGEEATACCKREQASRRENPRAAERAHSECRILWKVDHSGISGRARLSQVTGKGSVEGDGKVWRWWDARARFSKQRQVGRYRSGAGLSMFRIGHRAQ